MFTYSPLSREKRETRFFRFSPACESGSDRISLQLRHASLDDDALQYRALSYVWGDAKDKVDIEVNGEQFSVGQNLHALLQMLQHHGVEYWLWADAICIQQSDDDEKSWHVQRMCDIFKNAYMVYSWLGPGSKQTDVAMYFFADWGIRASRIGLMEKLWPTMESTRSHQRFLYLLKYANFEQGIDPFFLPRPVFEKSGAMDDVVHTKSKWYKTARFFYDLLHVQGLRETRGQSVLSDLETGIFQLFRNEYWHRIWIFQEVALAREVLLICGEKLLTFSYFEAVMEALWKFRSEFRQLLTDCPLRRGFCERFPPDLYPNKTILTRQEFRRGIGVSLGTILVDFAGHGGRPSYRATDPRDIVYGVLGILPDSERSLFGHADYKNATWVEIFAQATRSLIQQFQIRKQDDLSYGIGNCFPRPRNQPNELPSWVPDWRDVGANGLPESLAQRKSTSLDAGKHTKLSCPSSLRHRNPMVLDVAGCRVDVVADIMHYDYRSKYVPEKDRPKDWLAHIRTFTGLPEISDIGSLEGEDYVWRLVLECHSIRLLRDIHRVPLRHEYEKDRDIHRVPRSHEYKKEIACFIRRLMRQDYPDPQSLSEDLIMDIYAADHIWNTILRTKHSEPIHQDPTSRYPGTGNGVHQNSRRMDDEKGWIRREAAGLERFPNSIGKSGLRSFIDTMIHDLFSYSRSKPHTMFKTAKGMLGIGIGDVRPGDIVVLVWNAQTPFILRPRQQEGVERAEDYDTSSDSGGMGSQKSGTFTFGGEACVDGIMQGEFMKTEPKDEVFDIY